MSDIDEYFDDEIDAAAFDAVVIAATSIPPTLKPIVGGSSSNAFTQKKYIQPTIFGASQVPIKASSHNKCSSSQYYPPAPKSTQQAPKVKAVKKWDRLSAVKVLPDVLRSAKKNKKKLRAGDSIDEDEIQDEDEDEDLDSDTDLLLKALQNQDDSTQKQSMPMKLESDPEAIRKWIYSINKPKRKYQYDIVFRALFNNCLVSLPTGLGKTFIAAVVMLNFYRWYPKGKLIFLAPTRPLVQQQIEACHSIAGIPSMDCVSLTGTIPAVKRAEAWGQKRVIFATPQTVANDLRRGSLRPEDVICVVVDEAHRATGAYAYCVVVRLLMRFNPHFRVLALTATPGSDPERVQCVIDNLHIGHIEVRTEESMDIRPYTKNKEIILEKIALTPELMSIRDQWGKLMLPLIKQCGSLFHGSKEPAYIHAFSITSAQINIPKERAYLRPNLAVLSKMATAMGKLLEYSIPLAYEKMKELKNESHNKCARGVCSQLGYKSLMEEIEQLTKSPGFVPHPKMEKMKALTIDFFVNAQDLGKSSRVMIFCHFRDMVTDIVSYLNQERPLIKASPFVGQSNDVKGNRGMNQKTQNSVIQQFKNDEFNVLVATSIGEEGLDIGALDFIICYEAQKSPLRMLQRLGRTGRNEDGKVIVLIAEGREDKNWEKAQDQYQHVQNALLSKKVLELYEDCERLIPEGVRPIPVDEKIDVQPYIAEQVEIELAASKLKKNKGTKRKRPGLEDIPAGAVFGFVSAKDYKVPKSKAEALRERAENALLSAEEAATLKQQWSRNTTSANIQSPIDPNDMDIVYFPTKTPLGSRLEAIAPNKRLGRNVTRSYRYANIIRQSEEFIADDDKCEAWRSAQMAKWNEKNVILWSSEMRGKGPRRPLRLCADGSKSIRRFWQNSDTACNKNESTTDSVTVEHQPIFVSSSENEPSSPKVANESKQNHFSQSDLPEADEFICAMRSAKHSSPPHPPKVCTTPPKNLHRFDLTTGLDKPSGSHRLAAFQNTARAPSPFEPKISSGFQRLSAFKNVALQPTPYDPALKPDGANASSSKLTDSSNQHSNLPRERRSQDRHLDAASDSSAIETVPDSETESKPLAQTQDEPCNRSSGLLRVDKDTSANTSFCFVIPDSNEPPKQQYHQPDDLPMEAVFDSEGQFEELDPEDLQALDRLEKNFHQQSAKPSLLEPQAEANQRISSSPNDHLSELDMEALAVLDEIENRIVEIPSAGQGSIRRSPVTPNPNVHSSHHQFAKKSSLTSQAYDHSPLLFRSLGKKSIEKPLISADEHDNGESFLDPSTVMLGTQMPFNKRIPRILNQGIQPKRIIAELSEEEEDSDDHEEVGNIGKMNPPPLKPKLQNQPKGKQKMVGRSRRDNEWALKTGFFDMEAVRSESSDSEEGEEGTGAGRRKKRKKQRRAKKQKRKDSSPESIESENSIDRDFLVNTSSSHIKDNCSPDKSMSNFYRASILMMSQPLSVVKEKFKGSNKAKAPQPTTNNSNRSRWKTQSRSNHLTNQASTSRHRQDKSSDDRFINSNDDNDQFSFDSFCVPDEETIEYDHTNPDNTLDTSEI